MKSCFLSTARVGLKGPTGTFFFPYFRILFFFFYKKENLYILVKKKKTYIFFFTTDQLAVPFATRWTGNDNSSKDGLKCSTYVYVYHSDYSRSRRKEQFLLLFRRIFLYYDFRVLKIVLTLFYYFF